MNVQQYDGNALVSQLATDLKELPEFAIPDWAQFVKTSVARERPPVSQDWWYARVASVLRTVALKGPVGVNKLRRKYGGKQRRGYKPATFARGSGKIIRVALQQLEKSGMIKQTVVDGHKGRVLEKKGIEFIAASAKKLRA